MTHMEVAGGYVKQIWFVLGWAKGWQVKTVVFFLMFVGSISLCLYYYMIRGKYTV
jgi:hypothetical protein